jgi:octaprenyl-diphosphate synthase
VTEATGISRLADDQPIRAEKFLDLVAPKLGLVEDGLRRSFDSEIETIRAVGSHILDGGGKRLRPILLLLSSDLVGYRGDRDVYFATVVELIHTASLVHDDIIDEAEVRRGRMSINYLWGNQLTVLIGDYLYSQSMSMTVAEGNLEILRLLLGVTIRMTEGEVIGLEQNGRSDLTVDQYFEILGRKTAALFGASCRIPAILTQAPEPVGQALFDYGYNLGICFQIVDDVLDLASTDDALGKHAGQDLLEGIYTLPVIYALRESTELRDLLGGPLDAEQLDRARALACRRPANGTDAVELALGVARDHAVKASGALDGSDGLHPDVCRTLVRLVDGLVHRER